MVASYDGHHFFYIPKYWSIWGVCRSKCDKKLHDIGLFSNFVSLSIIIRNIDYNFTKMKKFYFSAAVATLAVSALAQQLPNAGFEESWNDCIPWTFYQNEENFGQLSQVISGINPSGWVISNVSGMASCYDGEAMGLGATVVGDSVQGYNSNYAVKLTNNPNPFMATQIVPAYITLGTTWSTANPAFDFMSGGIAIKNADGGSFGGMAFDKRPTGIEFMYKRNPAESNPSENATVVAYLWKGHWTQKDVPAIIYMAGEPYCTDMVDRDRCVLGMNLEGLQGGEVSKTDDAELIAVINSEITEITDEWLKFSAKFDYKSDATPEYINIIFAAGNYFANADQVVEGNTLEVDDVKLIYDEQPVAEVDKYPGKLTIEMAGAPLTPVPVDAEINLVYYDNWTCTMTLPNFSLDLGAGAMPLGDIVVPDVTYTSDGVVTEYVGEVKGMSLMGGAIVADVNVIGTINSVGEASFIINVLWEGIPIVVNFSGKGKPGQGTSAVSVNMTDDSATEYFNLNGMRVINPSNGIFIRRQGNKVSKVFVK